MMRGKVQGISSRSVFIESQKLSLRLGYVSTQNGHSCNTNQSFAAWKDASLPIFDDPLRLPTPVRIDGVKREVPDIVNLTKQLSS